MTSNDPGSLAQFVHDTLRPKMATVCLRLARLQSRGLYSDGHALVAFRAFVDDAALLACIAHPNMSFPLAARDNLAAEYVRWFKGCIAPGGNLRELGDGAAAILTDKKA